MSEDTVHAGIDSSSATEETPSREIKATTKARFGVVETVYFQQPETIPVAVDSRFTRWLDSEEQPYLRQAKIGQDWQEVDVGWLENLPVSQLVLRNDEGKFQVQPTSEQRALVMGRILELAILPRPDASDLTKCRTMRSPPKREIPPLSFAVLRPGQSLRFEPVDANRLVIRCKSGTARLTLFAIPA